LVTVLLGAGETIDEVRCGDGLGDRTSGGA
jgi:hypothetical protein